jgi:hypothetical protein
MSSHLLSPPSRLPGLDAEACRELGLHTAIFSGFGKCGIGSARRTSIPALLLMEPLVTWVVQTHLLVLIHKNRVPACLLITSTLLSLTADLSNHPP